MCGMEQSDSSNGLENGFEYFIQAHNFHRNWMKCDTCSKAINIDGPRHKQKHTQNPCRAIEGKLRAIEIKREREWAERMKKCKAFSAIYFPFKSVSALKLIWRHFVKCFVCIWCVRSYKVWERTWGDLTRACIYMGMCLFCIFVWLWCYGFNMYANGSIRHRNTHEYVINT